MHTAPATASLLFHRVERAKVDVRWHLGLAAALDAAAITAVIAGGAAPWAVVAGLVVHASAIVHVAKTLPRSDSQSALAVAAVATLPVFGSVMAAIVLTTHGRLDPELVHHEQVPKAARVVEAAELLDERTLLERLLGADAEVRGEAIAQLVRRADGLAVEALQKVLQEGGAEARLEAALALEELSARAERRLQGLREQARTEGPGYRALLALADGLLEVVASGIAEPELSGRLLQEAKAACARAGPEAAARLARARWLEGDEGGQR